MDQVNWVVTAVMALFVWYIKWSYSKNQNRIENDILNLFKKLDHVEESMPTKTGVEKLADDNREGHKELWIEVRNMGESIANIRGSMGKNGK